MRLRVWTWAITVLVAGLLAGRPATAQPRRGPGVRLPRAGRPGGPMARPGKTILDRLDQMSPEERRKALENLPPERRKRLEEQLERYERLTPQERARLLQQYRQFREFPPEQQDAARRLFQRFSGLPEERRGLVRAEVRELRAMDEADRRARINSDEFRNKYTLAEQQLLQDLMKLAPDQD